MSRPKSPLDVQDQTDLVRIANVAARMMSVLRAPGRGSYPSERQLRTWMTADGWTHTTSDIGPALNLLESTNRIVRPEVKPNTPRPGRLAKGADVWARMARGSDEVHVPEDGPADASEAVVEAAEAAVGETDPVADVEAEITAESAVVSEDIVQASNHIEGTP